VLHRKSHAIGVGESLGLSAFYITIGLGFGGIFWLWLGSQAGMEPFSSCCPWQRLLHHHGFCADK